MHEVAFAASWRSGSQWKGSRTRSAQVSSRKGRVQAAARRKELSSQLRALPMSKDTMEEVIKAKAEWCAANPAAAASSPVCAVKKASSAGLKTEPRV